MIHFEPSLAELCFETFRKEFPHHQVHVEGNRMIYRYIHKKVLEVSKELAEIIIEKHKMPIEVTIDISKVSTLPMLLILTYKEQLNEEEQH
jgi:hypothetical protein